MLAALLDVQKGHLEFVCLRRAAGFAAAGKVMREIPGCDVVASAFLAL